ncbi:RimJ/RimL family protein N-acetyltransferase [Kibdelosporangium banguiense]|uniref:RimJ/RimL family protein N-acetyltransferase n=1 Tax=Kibdelosporangium banguiense TaxID=1365924 RepID=A0ABS4TLU9_9PSEU|nr:GNAT family protein [Kibdelosporangium banguiense]MBP2325396.1 RimJ/RimL family protein N-acetyltransferase [Kibdelosporangium banguiense]
MLILPLADGAELRALEPWNAAEFAEHIDRARENLRPWIAWATTLVDEETCRAFLKQYTDKQASDSGRLYGMWVDGTLVGGTLFRTFDTRMGSCEVGVWLEPAASGRGLITAAVRHMIEWAVCARGMSRVEWRCSPANERSVAVAQRLGMTKEGVLRSEYPLNGTRQDAAVYSVLATEWLARK